MKTIKVAIIRNTEDYKEALTRLNRIYNAMPGTDKFIELKLLTGLIEEFEKETCPIPKTTPQELVKFILLQNGQTPEDLVGKIASQSSISDIFSNKRPMSLLMIYNISQYLKMPMAELLKKHID